MSDIQTVHDRTAEITAREFRRDGSGKGLVCPCCGSGSGPHGTGLQVRQWKGVTRFKCWAGGCFNNSDIFDLIGFKYNLGSFKERLAKCLEILNLERTDRPDETGRPAGRDRGTNPEPETVRTDFTDYFKFTRKTLLNQLESGRGFAIDYLAGKRRVPLEVLKETYIGADSAFVPPSGRLAPVPRIIFPSSRHGFATRALFDGPGSKYNVGEQRIFNAQILDPQNRRHDPRPYVCVTEGQIDCLSVLGTGHPCVAMCSVNNGKKLLEALRNSGKTAILIPDNDNSGLGVTKFTALAQTLGEQGIDARLAGSVLRRLRDCGLKDVNELAQAGIGFAELLDADTRGAQTPRRNRSR